MTPEDDEQQEQPGAAPPPGAATPVDDEAAYAQQRAAEIARWAVTPPSWVARGFNRSLAPASRAVQALVPVALLRRVLAREIPGAKFVIARSILELRLRPQRLLPKILRFLESARASAAA